jgi:hypothetical protein
MQYPKKIAVMKLFGLPDHLLAEQPIGGTAGLIAVQVVPRSVSIEAMASQRCW